MITAVSKGEPAPFTGDLYPVADSVRMALEIDACDQRSKAALDQQRRLAQVEVERVRDLARASADANKRRVQLLTDQLDATRAWYRSTPFVAAVAVASTVAVLLTSTVLVQATAEVRR